MTEDSAGMAMSAEFVTRSYNRRAMKRADKAGDLTGSGVMKKGFETMRNFHIGLGAGDVTYTPTDHRAASACLVQEWKDGKFQKVEFVDLKARWPKKWEKEWLGW